MGIIITGGAFRGRKLVTDSSSQIIRPTSGKVREALFSSLGERLDQASFVDLYSGTGAVGLEAISRGAREVYLVENHAHSWKILKSNVGSVLGESEAGTRVQTMYLNAKIFCERMRSEGKQFDIVFADPPFADDFSLLQDQVLSIVAPDGVGIIQFPTRNPPAWLEASVSEGTLRLKRYGESGLAFLTGQSIF